MLNAYHKINIHNQLSEILEKALKANLMVDDYKQKIVEYKAMPSFQKWQCFYTETELNAEQKKYERYYRLLVRQYDNLMEQINNKSAEQRIDNNTAIILKQLKF